MPNSNHNISVSKTSSNPQPLANLLNSAVNTHTAKDESTGRTATGKSAADAVSKLTGK